MTSQKLLSPSTLAFHLLLVAGFLIYARLFGPPKPVILQVPKGELATIIATDNQKLGEQDSLVNRSVLLTETRPGSMNHKSFFEREGKLWGKLENEWLAELTLDQRVQQISKAHFSKSKAALGALALVEVKTGRVIGLQEFVNQDHPVTRRMKLGDDVHLGLRSIAPGSGLFRLVTASSLLDAGLNPLQKYCYQKFKGTWLQAKHLNPTESNAHCNHLNEALSTTDNSYLAYVSNKLLSADKLKKSALDLGFDRRFSYFGLPYELSVAHIPSQSLERAKTAVGIQGSKMNTLHAAMMMAAIATDGTLKSPRLVEYIQDRTGQKIEAPNFPPMANGMSASSAARLRRMMKNAILENPAGRVFQDWPQKIRKMKVAGQASVRTFRKPDFVRYTWFVGYVPAQDPQWSIAVMVVNHEQWYVRALDIAHRVLKDVLVTLDE